MDSTTHNAPLDRDPEDSRVRRFEIAAVLAITLAGFALRVASPSRAAVEHFDEGVYATRLWFAEGEDAPYPDRHLYAPPLVPWMVRWSVDLFGPGLWGAMLPAVVFGTLTIPLVWWTARRWFGGVAGVAGAVLAAGSDFHVLYSRTALTDVPLCFWLLASVYCAWESFRAGSIRWAVAAGIAAGLAWWTKYNGWLALAIAGAGVAPWVGCRWLGCRMDGAGWSAGEVRTGRENGAAVGWWRVAGCWIVLAIVACAVWSPVFVGARGHGGYGAILANHRRYVVGVAGWGRAFLEQVANHLHLDGILSWAAVGVACLLPLACRLVTGQRLTWLGTLGMFSIAAVAVPFAISSGSSPILALGAIVGILGHLVCCGAAPDRDARLAGWLLLAWFAGLLVATPLYRAYPRLTLPWLISAWLGAAGSVGWLARSRWWDERHDTAANRGRFGIAAGLAAALAIAVIAGARERIANATVSAWQDRTGMQQVAGRMLDDMEGAAGALPGNERATPLFVAYVYAEPALVFHLTEAGLIAQPASNLGFVRRAMEGPRVPTFFVAGPHARGTPEFAEQWDRDGSQFELIAEYEYKPSGLVWLNLHSSLESAAGNGVARDREPVRLYLLR